MSRWSLIVSVVALLGTLWIGYLTQLRPFSVDVGMNPIVQLQQKYGNLGLYVQMTCRNKSWRPGLLTDLYLVVWRSDTPEDKYLLIVGGYPGLGPDMVFRDSGYRLPFPLGPHEWLSQTVNFVYASDSPFPIATGTYVAELLVTTDFEPEARYSETVRFTISADVLREYEAARAEGSTRLQPVLAVGQRPEVARKLTEAEYSALRR